MIIGSLFAKLSINTAQFDQGLKNARMSMKRMAMDMQVASAVTASAGVALGAMGMASISAAKEVSRLSQVANSTPRDLQRWSAATKSVGIDQEKLADILKDVNDRVGDFLSTGGGPMKDFFEQIGPKVGVTAEHFKNLSGPEALQLYVSSLEKAGASQQQMTFFMEAMASDSTLLLPLLRDNAAALNEIGDAAEKSGAIMDDKTIANLAQAGKAVGGMTQAFVGMRNEIAGALAPAITDMANGMRKAMQEGGLLRSLLLAISNNAGRIASYMTGAAIAFGAYASAVTVATIATMGFKRALTRTGIGALVVGLGELVYWTTAVQKKTEDTGKTFMLFKELAKAGVNSAVEWVVWGGEQIKGSFRGAAAAIVQIFKEIPNAIKSVMVAGANMAIWAVEKMINGVGALVNKFFDGVNGLIEKLPRRLGGGGRMSLTLVPELSIPRINAETKKVKDSLLDIYGAAVDEFNGSQGSLPAPKIFDVDSVRDVWAKIKGIVGKDSAEAGEAVDELNRKIGGLGSPRIEDAGKEAGKAIDEIDHAAERAKNSVGMLRDSMASAFAGVLTGANSARDAVSRLLSSLADTAANSAFQNLFNGLLGSGTAAGGGANWFGKAAGWLFGGIPQFANGGVAPGGLAMVGERGAELVNLPGGSRVFDAQTTKDMLSGGGTIVLEIRRSEDADVRVLEAAGNQAVRIVEGGLQEFSDHVLPARQAQISNDWRVRG